MAGGVKLRCTFVKADGTLCAHEGFQDQGIINGCCWQHRRASSAPRARPVGADVGPRTCLGYCRDGSRCMRAQFLAANGYCTDHQPRAQRAPSPAARRAPSPAPRRTPTPAPALAPPSPTALAPARKPTTVQAAAAQNNRHPGPSILDGVATPQRVSRAQYVKKLKAAGVQLRSDQDVYHIISSENGGADHPDNYHFVQNRAWNRAIGANHDHINCFMAGRESALKAVAISQQLGNNKGKLYNGPSADTLYKSGENAMRDVRVRERHVWAKLRISRAA